jgi:hypothetical protein
MASSWLSQTAYSSAVRLASVAVRHWAIQPVAVVHREQRVGVALLDRQKHYAASPKKTSPAEISRSDPSASLSFSAPSGATPSARPSTRLAPQPRHGGPIQPRRPRLPGVEDRLEAQRLPPVHPDREGLGQHCRRRLDRRRRQHVAAQMMDQRRRRPLGPLGRMGQIDADPDRQPQAARLMRAGLDQHAGCLLARQHHVIGPFDRHQRRRRIRVQQVGDGQERR